MKVILVDKCLDCPFLGTSANTQYHHCKKDSLSVDVESIPERCALQGAKTGTYSIRHTFDNKIRVDYLELL